MLFSYLLAGCASKSGAAPSNAPTSTTSEAPSAESSTAVRDPLSLLVAAEDALGADDPARAVALFGRFLATDSDDVDGLARAYRGLGRAHERLRDFQGAIVAYETYLSRFATGGAAADVWGRKGACEAELERWEASARSFRRMREAGELLPSARIEALAREGFALFSLDRFDAADEVLAEADAVYERAMREDAERFSTYYFIGMARFYRAAIVHRRFRDVEIELPEKVMAKSFKKKLDLLVRAQDAYRHTIEAKHVFWVSAAGYQLGHMFGEFYDALMYAPVPKWLDERQRHIYYEELEKQLRPVIGKAIWVFEKNIETARRLGYENPFIERTEAKLAHLQSVLLSDEDNLGQPRPRLTKETDEAVGPDVEGTPAAGNDEVRAADRKLFVPEPTPL